MIVIDKLAFIIFILIFIFVSLIVCYLGSYVLIQDKHIEHLERKCNIFQDNITDLKHEIYKRDFKLFKGD